MRPEDFPSLGDFAEAAIASGEEQSAIPVIANAAQQGRRPLMWHWLGLLHRSLDQHEEALQAFEQAAAQAPRGPKIAHARAHTAMEAGLPAVALFETALELAPQDGSVIVGLAGARAAEGHGQVAADELQRVLSGAPAWTYGHEQLAQLRCTLGEPDRATESLEEALERFPTAAELWETLLFVELRRGAYERLPPILDRARAAGAQSAEFPIYDAIVAAELAADSFPEPLFGSAPQDRDSDLDRWRIRHLLRVGSPHEAVPILDRALEHSDSAEMWAYASTVWRLTQDPRSEWLQGDDRLVSVVDISDLLPPLEQLAASVRQLHVAKGEYLDQSVRGGTQTDGPLFSRVDPTIRHVRRAVVEAVHRHLSQLPPSDPGHPLLKQQRDRRIRFSGSWSVRLRSGGRHSNHVHPQGWISSALYIALPEIASDEPANAGWLTLGQPDDQLGVDVPALREVAARPGQLVLFPSWMWHGTRPFREGERLTIAFDVRPPI